MSHIFKIVVIGWFVGMMGMSFGQESISISLGTDRGSTVTTAGYLYGPAPADGEYWNNFSGKSGSFTTLKSSSGVTYDIVGAWSSNNTWDVFSSKNVPPVTLPNATLYYGYLDDGGSRANFNITAGADVFFSSDLYYLPSSDSNTFRFVKINNVDYSGTSGATLQGNSSDWGSAASAKTTSTTTDITLTEGVNYLRIQGLTGSALTIAGQANGGNKNRGSFAGLQIVNTADSLSRKNLSGNITLSENVWTNDLTGAENQAWSDGKAIRLITNADTTVDLGGANVTLGKFKKLGSGNLAFTNGQVSFGYKDMIIPAFQISADTGVVDLGNFGKLGTRAIYKFTTEKATGRAEGVISGGYFGNAFASVQADGSIAAATMTNDIAENADLLNNSRRNVGSVATLNSLVTQSDFLIDSGKTVLLTTGMIALQGVAHWIQGSEKTSGGNLMSGYQNAAGEYEFYGAAFGSVADMQTANIGFLDNNGVTTNFIKSGDGNFQIRNSKSSAAGQTEYSGRTVVLEGKLYVLGSDTVSRTSGFDVKSGAGLFIGTNRADNKDYYGAVTLSTGGICGEGSVTLGYNNADGNFTLTGDKGNFVHDGTTLSSFNFAGNSLDISGTAVLNAKSVVSTGKNVTLRDNAQLNVTSLETKWGTTLTV